MSLTSVPPSGAPHGADPLLFCCSVVPVGLCDNTNTIILHLRRFKTFHHTSTTTVRFLFWSVRLGLCGLDYSSIFALVAEGLTITITNTITSRPTVSLFLSLTLP